MKYVKLFEQFLNESNKGNWVGSANPNPVSFWGRSHYVVLNMSNGSLSKNEAENIIDLINDGIKRYGYIKRMDFKNLEDNGILNDLKYYDKTEKIVGKIPTFMFSKKPNYKNSIKLLKMYDILLKNYPNLELTLKKVVK